MTRFLAIIRRIFLGGTVALLLCKFLFHVDFTAIINDTGSSKAAYAGLFMISPVIFIIFTLISVAYIRKRGQFAASHQADPWFVSLLKCLGHDIVSPFKNIGGFFGAIFNKDAMGRGVLIRRFIGMIILILFYAVGVLTLIK